MFALRSRVGAAALADNAATIDRAVARSVLNARFFDAVIDVLKTRIRHELRAKGLAQCSIADAIATAALVRGVLVHFSLSVDGHQRNRMAEAARINSKAPVGKASEFSGDAATKQAAASAGLRQAIESFARPELEHLKRLHAR